MLKTCLKHDFRAIRKLLGLDLLLIVALALAGGICIRLCFHLQQQEATIFGILASFSMIGAMVCLFGVIAVATAGFYYPFVDFYQKLFTDQGYLTFTLPVKRSVVYLSKVIVGTLAQIAVFLSLSVGIIFYILTIPGASEVFSHILRFFAAVVDLGAGPLALIIPLLLLLVTGVLFSNGLLYMCIVLGCTQIKKHKLIASIAIYYLSSSVISAVSMFAVIPLIASGVYVLDSMVSVGGGGLWLAIGAFITIAAMVLGCLAAIFHYVALGLLDKKINLA